MKNLQQYPLLAVLKSCDLMASLSEEDLLDLAECSRSRVVKPGIIFEQGDPATSAILVATGEVALCKDTVHGKKVTVTLLGPGEPAGLIAVVQDRPLPLSAVAIKESVIIDLCSKTIKKLFATNHDFLTRLLSVCTDRMMRVQEVVSLLAGSSSEVRIAHALLLYAAKFGVTEGDRRVLTLSRKDLALFASVTTETSIRVTRQFESEGLLNFPANKKIELLSDSKLKARCTGVAL